MKINQTEQQAPYVDQGRKANEVTMWEYNGNPIMTLTDENGDTFSINPAKARSLLKNIDELKLFAKQ